MSAAVSELANLHGSNGHNIPNDNLVELMVQAIKKKVYAQGANASYQSVQKAALTIQIQDEIKNNMKAECGQNQSGTRRPTSVKLNNIEAIVKELNSIRAFEYIPGREYPSFSGFTEIFSSINITDLHKWITQNKERLSDEIV